MENARRNEFADRPGTLLRATHLAPQQGAAATGGRNPRRMMQLSEFPRKRYAAMILVLEPNTNPDSTEYQVLIGQLVAACRASPIACTARWAPK